MQAPPPPEDPAALDALFQDHQADWWDRFYRQRDRPVPFFTDAPDEHLWQAVQQGWMAPGRALDLGCGQGRNAIFLAQRGFVVQAVDLSGEALAWARERASALAVPPRWTQASVFDLAIEPASVDLVCDSGCFHHLPPHRRADYVALVGRALKPGGWLALACFRPEGGSGLSDEAVYQRRSLGGGLGYSEAQLRGLWAGPLQIHHLRPMQAPAPGSGVFGAPFLWAMLAQRPAGPGQTPADAAAG
jgi:SAM-dependent methyltransferase